jgi:hypothetical protein
MRQQVADAKAAGDTNLQGSFNRQQTAATNGNVVSSKKPDATLVSTDKDGNTVVRNGERPSPAASQTVETESAKLNDIANGAKAGVKVENYIMDPKTGETIRYSPLRTPRAAGLGAAARGLGELGLVLGAVETIMDAVDPPPDNCDLCT